MKLLDIKLHNIGPYKKEEITLDCNKHNNLVLICGDNGSGKTTILNAIKVGLFGNFLYGLNQKNTTNAYFEQVKSLITNNKKNGSISIEFTIIEDYVESKYLILDLGI